MTRLATVVIVVCAASAGAHAALVPDHLEHEPRLGIAFVAATALLLAAAVALAYRPDDAPVATGTALFAGRLDRRLHRERHDRPSVAFGRP
jgi:hypothetical protein